jgi:hypothetical protein
MFKTFVSLPARQASYLYRNPVASPWGIIFIGHLAGFFWCVSWSILGRSLMWDDVHGKEKECLIWTVCFLIRCVVCISMTPKRRVLLMLLRRPWILIVLCSVKYRNNCYIFWVVCYVRKNGFSSDYLSFICGTTTYCFHYLRSGHTTR